MRTHRRANGFQFAHQLVIDVQSTGGVKENNIVPFVPGSVDGISANRDGFADGPSELGAAFRFPVERHLARSTPGGFHTLHHGLKLFNRGGPLQIGGRHQDFPAFVLPPRGQLATRGGFSRALQTAQHHDGGSGLHPHGGRSIWPHQFHEFVVDHADHFFARLQTFGDFSAEGFGDDLFAERVHHLVVHIGFQKLRSALRPWLRERWIR